MNQSSSYVYNFKSEPKFERRRVWIRAAPENSDDYAAWRREGEAVSVDDASLRAGREHQLRLHESLMQTARDYRGVHGTVLVGTLAGQNKAIRQQRAHNQQMRDLCCTRMLSTGRSRGGGGGQKPRKHDGVVCAVFGPCVHKGVVSCWPASVLTTPGGATTRCTS